MQESPPRHSGTLLIISGPSGVGKSTICRHLVEQLNAFLSVSATTRPPRPGEVDGVNYHFMSVEQFEQQLERGSFLEYARVYGGHYYGTPAEPVLQILANNRVVILEIEIDGTLQVMRRFPDAISVYLLPPTPAEQKERLEGRKQDSLRSMQERLSKADGEIGYAKDCGVYRYFIVNDTIPETVETIVRIVRENQQA